MISLRSLNKIGWSFQRNFLSLTSAKLSSKSDRLVISEFNDDEGIATIAFNRPPMSSFTLELLQEFSEALDSVNNKKDCKGLILTSVNCKN
jgi:1,4-dihydroxy-2-naphthoyl-CoA synthase